MNIGKKIEKLVVHLTLQTFTKEFSFNLTFSGFVEVYVKMKYLSASNHLSLNMDNLNIFYPFGLKILWLIIDNNTFLLTYILNDLDIMRS
jgi:hypothetical protein